MIDFLVEFRKAVEAGIIQPDELNAVFRERTSSGGAPIHRAASHNAHRLFDTLNSGVNNCFTSLRWKTSVLEDMCLFLGTTPRAELLVRLGQIDALGSNDAVLALLDEAREFRRAPKGGSFSGSTPGTERKGRESREASPAARSRATGNSLASSRSTFADEPAGWWQSHPWLMTTLASVLLVTVSLLLTAIPWAEADWHWLDQLTNRNPRLELAFSVGTLPSMLADAGAVSSTVRDLDGKLDYPLLSQAETLPVTFVEGPPGSYVLSSRFPSQMLRFPFFPGAEERDDVHRFGLAIGSDWEFVSCSLELQVQHLQGGGRTSVRETSAFRVNDTVQVLDSSGTLLAELTLLMTQPFVLLPVSRPADFSYRLKRGERGSAAERLSYDGSIRVLTAKVQRRDTKAWRFIDELTGIDLKEGRPIIGIDPLTRERLFVGYSRPDELDGTEYHRAPILPGLNRYRLRPMSVHCEIQCVDGMTGKPVDGATFRATGCARYDAETRELLFLPPTKCASLSDSRIVVDAEGYDTFKLPLGPQLAAYTDDGKVTVRLERSRTNIVVVFPASVGMGRVLGRSRFDAAKEFLDEVERSLEARCAPLGYPEADVFVLKDRGLEPYDENPALTYQAADRPESLFVRSLNVETRSIFQDSRLKDRLGKHSVLIVVLGDFNPPGGKSIAKGIVMHLHLAKFWGERDSEDEYLKRYCEENSDQVTYLTAGDGATMTENARLLARDVEASVRSLVRRGTDENDTKETK